MTFSPASQFWHHPQKSVSERCRHPSELSHVHALLICQVWRYKGWKGQSWGRHFGQGRNTGVSPTTQARVWDSELRAGVWWHSWSAIQKTWGPSLNIAESLRSVWPEDIVMLLVQGKLLRRGVSKHTTASRGHRSGGPDSRLWPGGVLCAWPC